MALDLTWDQWTEAVLDTPETGTGQSFRRAASRTHQHAATPSSVNAGAERLFFGEGFVIPLRFGAAWEPQGARNPYTRDPVNFTMLALGTGYNTNSLKFDAAFQYRWASFETGADFGLNEIQPAAAVAVGEQEQPGMAAQVLLDPAPHRHGQAAPHARQDLRRRRVLVRGRPARGARQAFRSTFDSGSVRTRLPVAAKIAFSTAGTTGGSAGSPEAGGRVVGLLEVHLDLGARRAMRMSG